MYIYSYIYMSAIYEDTGQYSTVPFGIYLYIYTYMMVHRKRVTYIPSGRNRSRHCTMYGIP